jgi:hypothetical protein
MTKWAGVHVAEECLIGNRDTYEDRSFAVELPPGQSPFGFQAVVAVADGMGGHNAGDVAAEDAIGKIRDVACGERGDTRTLDLSDPAAGAGPRSMLCCDRYPVNVRTLPSSIVVGIATVRTRLGSRNRS